MSQILHFSVIFKAALYFYVSLKEQTGCLRICQKYVRTQDLSACLGYFLILCWDEDHCDKPVILHGQFYVGRKAGWKCTLRKTSVRISSLISRLRGNVQPCSYDYKIFMSSLWPGLDEKLESEIQSAGRAFRKERTNKQKTCLESWGAVCSYLCSNSERTISWTDLWEVVQADMPDNWNLRAWWSIIRGLNSA